MKTIRYLGCMFASDFLYTIAIYFTMLHFVIRVVSYPINWIPMWSWLDPPADFLHRLRCTILYSVEDVEFFLLVRGEDWFGRGFLINDESEEPIQ